MPECLICNDTGQTYSDFGPVTCACTRARKPTSHVGPVADDFAAIAKRMKELEAERPIKST